MYAFREKFWLRETYYYGKLISAWKLHFLQRQNSIFLAKVAIAFLKKNSNLFYGKFYIFES